MKLQINKEKYITYKNKFSLKIKQIFNISKMDYFFNLPKIYKYLNKLRLIYKKFKN